jgi:hypothetical protein
MKVNDVTILLELDSQVPGMQDVGDDNSTKYARRQTRLTLKQINKLRKMNDIREYEKEAKLKNIRAQYGTPADGGGEPF